MSKGEEGSETGGCGDSTSSPSSFSSSACEWCSTEELFIVIPGKDCESELCREDGATGSSVGEGVTKALIGNCKGVAS